MEVGSELESWWQLVLEQRLEQHSSGRSELDGACFFGSITHTHSFILSRTLVISFWAEGQRSQWPEKN